jgi:predicted HAD superfamily Cof-like phosphohydrolase
LNHKESVIAEQSMVEEFHREFGLTINHAPTIPSRADMDLRFNLIDEELRELDLAMIKDDIVKVADAIADLLYVVYGTAVTFGLNMKSIFEEVHRSNMSKVGGVKRADGKIIKPDTYSPANLEPIIDKQRK